jgi:hypothetical protein
MEDCKRRSSLCKGCGLSLSIKLYIMGLLDNELKSIKSEYIRKPEWATCRYCKLPFKTSCFENSCQRCKHFDLYLVELNAKMMLLFIVFCIIISIVLVSADVFIINYTKNRNIILFLSTIFCLVVGWIMSKIIWKFMK